MDRICHRCSTRPAQNTKGPAICSECRMAPPDRPSRPRKYVTCNQCGSSYRTTGGNRICSACRHQAAKHPCADCGVQVDKRAEVCRSCWGKRHSGDAAYGWKGGRVTKTKHGYVLVASPGHPGAQGPSGYVREHRLVMERLLGRYLLPNESVHHRNGQKDDNRPENLELWVKSQPSGQRAGDLLTWARDIIATYGPVQGVLFPPS